MVHTKGRISVDRPEGNEAEPIVLNIAAPKNYENKVQNVQIVQKVQLRVRAP